MGSLLPRTPEQGPLLEYPPDIKYAESWLEKASSLCMSQVEMQAESSHNVGSPLSRGLY